MTFPLDSEYSYELRLEMITEQLIRRGLDQEIIIETFKHVPRHCFIPHVTLEEAYGDHPVGIKAGQTISQPYIVAIMLVYMNLSQHHTVLEIGSGSGYSTALLSNLVRHVDALEVYRELVIESRVILESLGVSNITITQGSAWEQFEHHHVYDRIVLWASPPRVPEHLFDMLSEGGVLVTPEGKSQQYVWVYKKNRGQLSRDKKDAVRFVPLIQGTAEEIDGKSGGKIE